MKQKTNRLLNGSTVVEAAYLFPVIMIVWMLVLFTLFYYHDKNILSGAAYETAVAGSELAHHEKDLSVGKLEQYCRQKIEGKLIFFSGAAVTVEGGKDRIVVTARASSKGMRVSVEKGAAVTTPEKKIRKFKIGKERLEDLTDE